MTGTRGISKNRDSQNREHYRRKLRGKFINIECHCCGLKGHTKKFYQKLKKKNRGKEEKKEDNDNCIATVTSEDLVIVLDANLINIACDELSQVVDFGDKSHRHQERIFSHLIFQVTLEP